MRWKTLYELCFLRAEITSLPSQTRPIFCRCFLSVHGWNAISIWIHPHIRVILFFHHHHIFINSIPFDMLIPQRSRAFAHTHCQKRRVYCQQLFCRRCSRRTLYIKCLHHLATVSFAACDSYEYYANSAQRSSLARWPTFSTQTRYDVNWPPAIRSIIHCALPDPRSWRCFVATLLEKIKFSFISACYQQRDGWRKLNVNDCAMRADVLDENWAGRFRMGLRCVMCACTICRICWDVVTCDSIIRSPMSVWR